MLDIVIGINGAGLSVPLVRRVRSIFGPAIGAALGAGALNEVDDDGDGSTRTGGGGCLGASGTISFGASRNIGSASGRSSGTAISNPTIAHWTVIEAIAVQRAFGLTT
jgi:hypothetical protein